ncbi:gamma-glutamyl-gamma-aminobutyrate hydrolase family protein [Salipaludibacillus sp. LMS25]|jgi:putative glutamine amidotransferase|uniref:gamma-glutamyl-gamma-aminobutyrate hydrolase family protein n=1 Tax=Salipaludibacillus sp. LMS25 TaxID=2924031 RepID=UPI0020D1CC4D|nr:gamma-glutamyl-gamma-aminobutyrate hydrolase family protein [Salipaludibacillus sp. LMS25]UTR13976.1 gamma-glutamyl-gamma-aminobutyrate hydrolase family protein [Salipaludibacillus sp. LMS25]
MKPFIGITSSYGDEKTLNTSYDNIDSITQAGGVPVVLPNVPTAEAINVTIGKLDGMLITGGGDIDPHLFNEEPLPNLGLLHPQRDQFEVALLNEAMARNLPILALCRGCQILNIAAGGDMYQDIYSQITKPLLQHTQRAPRSFPFHTIHVTEESLLKKITGKSKYRVNSFHHQAVRRLAEGFHISALSDDGIIEAFESSEHSFVLAVQWHPESMATDGDVPSRKLFSAFMNACQQNMA